MAQARDIGFLLLLGIGWISLPMPSTARALPGEAAEVDFGERAPLTDEHRAYLNEAAALLDPEEREADVRRQLVRYLGCVPQSPRAFSVCLVRLEDVDEGVRFHAQEALQCMTGTRAGRDPESWRAWRKDHPEWQVAKSGSAR